MGTLVIVVSSVVRCVLVWRIKENMGGGRESGVCDRGSALRYNCRWGVAFAMFVMAFEGIGVSFARISFELD